MWTAVVFAPMGSIGAAHRLSCSMVYGISPDQESNPCSCIGEQILYCLRYREDPVNTYINEMFLNLINIETNPNAV